MPPTDRAIISFAAEPPQSELPFGDWSQTLREYFVAACAQIHTDEAIGEPGEVRWFPDRTYGGRTYVPASARTSEGYEVFGFVSFIPAEEGVAPTDFEGNADFTGDVAENNPDWRLDINSWAIATWRGEDGEPVEITLVWGVPLASGGEIVTAELANLAVDQCALIEDRFTLVSPDSHDHNYLEVKLWGRRWDQPVAVESLYAEDDDAGADDGADTPEAE